MRSIYSLDGASIALVVILHFSMFWNDVPSMAQGQWYQAKLTGWMVKPILVIPRLVLVARYWSREGSSYLS